MSINESAARILFLLWVLIFNFIWRLADGESLSRSPLKMISRIGDDVIGPLVGAEEAGDKVLTLTVVDSCSLVDANAVVVN